MQRAYPPLGKSRPHPYPNQAQSYSPLNPHFSHHRSPIRLYSSTPVSPSEYSPCDPKHRGDYFSSLSLSPDTPSFTRTQSASPRTRVITSGFAETKSGGQLPPKTKLSKVVHVYSAGDDAVALRIKRDRERRKTSTAGVLRSRHQLKVKIQDLAMPDEVEARGREESAMEVVLDERWDERVEGGVAFEGSGVYARRKEAKRSRVGEDPQHDTSSEAARHDVEDRCSNRSAGSPRRPSLPGFNSILNAAGISTDPDQRPSLTSATSFPDLASLSGPLTSRTVSSGSSFSYTLSPTSSGRLSHFSSFGFDPRSSLGSLESPRSSVSGPPPPASFPWWNRDGMRSQRDEGPASAEGSEPHRKPSFARFAFDAQQRSPILDGDRRSSEKTSHTSRMMDRDEEALQRYSRFQSYPSGTASTRPSHGPALVGRRGGEAADPVEMLRSGENVSLDYRRESHHVPDTASQPLLHAAAAPSILHQPSDNISRPHTPTDVSPLVSLANAAALANERERAQRRASHQGAETNTQSPRERLSSGPTFGPFTDDVKTRAGSLQGISLWSDDERLGASGLADLALDRGYVRRTGSLTDADERQGRPSAGGGRGSSLNASPSRPSRHDKPYPSRGERAYRPRMTSIADPGMPGRHLGDGTTSNDAIPMFSSRPRVHGLPIDYRRDSAIPPEGFAPVNRGHEDQSVRVVKLEDPDYPSVLRRDPSRAISGRSSSQVTPTGSAVSTPMMQAAAPAIMVPPGYTLTPVYAHPNMGSTGQASFSPYYAGSQAVPLMMVPMGVVGQGSPAGPFSGGQLVLQAPSSGPSQSGYSDVRRDGSGRDNQQGPRYTCEVCHKQFNRPSSLKIHMYSHTGEKPYPCTWPSCRRSFSVQSNLKRHAKVHLDNEAAADAQAEAFGSHAQGGAARMESSGRRTSHALNEGGHELDEEEEDELEEDDDVDMEDECDSGLGRVGHESAIRVKREE